MRKLEYHTGPGMAQMNTYIPSNLKNEAVAAFQARGITYGAWLKAQLHALIAEHQRERRETDSVGVQ